MSRLPTIIENMQIDMLGYEYDESQDLTHIDGFLVCYHQSGRLILNTHLTDEEKLQGIQKLLSYVGHVTLSTPGLYFWTKSNLSQVSVNPSYVGQNQAPPADLMVSGDLGSAVQSFFMLTSPDRLQASMLIPLLHLSHTFMQETAQTLKTRPAIRQVEQQNEHRLVQETTPAGYYVQLSLRDLAQPRWSILVKVEPLVEGQIILSLGQQTFAAPITSTAPVVLADIEPALLLSLEGPDLDVWLEPAIPTDG